MKKSVSFWQFIGFFAAGIGGVLLHFLYDWTNESAVSAIISGVNESTWEHMKLLFWPLFIFAMVEYRFLKEYESFWCIKLVGTVLGITMIPVMYYTINGAIGQTPDWINIAIFFISAAEALLLEALLFKKDIIKCKRQYAAFFVLCAIAVVFTVFTFVTPELPIFRDPLTGTYGRSD